MSKLYGEDLSKTFDKIYQGFIDYKEEYSFYSRICSDYQVTSVMEIGCGTGNLAPLFTQNFYDYLGLDYSEHMLALAHEKFPSGNFVQGDMRNFKVARDIDAILITGRSTSYLLTDADMNNTLGSISNALEGNGHFIFDFIDATRFIPFITNNPSVDHQAVVDGINYVRESKWYRAKGKEHFMVDWMSNYYSFKGTNRTFLGNDSVIFRVFTQNEIKSFLETNGFKILEIIDRKTYAFDSFMVIAQKLN